MSRRARIWFIVAAIFTVVNLWGMVMAAAAGEVIHTCIHIVLTLLGAVAAWRLLPRRVSTY